MTGDGPTSLGLSERLERVLAYLLGWVSGLILLLLERKNRNVQWHAKQSIAVFGPLSIILWLTSLLGNLLGGIWVIGGLFSIDFTFFWWIFLWVSIILAVWLMIMAWFRPNYRLPFVSDWIR